MNCALRWSLALLSGTVLLSGCGGSSQAPAPTCTDGQRNGAETGIDCGGSACPRCAPGGGCLVSTDCTTGVCSNGACAVAPTISCPSASELPVASTYADYLIDGTKFWPASATSWSWTVTGGACDQLLQATAGHGTFTVAGATTSQLVFRPMLPGEYAVRLDVATPSGPQRCDLPVRVRAPGIRVALCWDTTGATDLDLHVHRSGTTTPWFTTTLTGSTNNPDDCFYGTCACAPTGPAPSWGYASSPLAACAATPSGACWTASVGCRNPRIEVDNVSTAGIPEITAIDVPQSGDTFRVMAHYYAGVVTTYPVVAVYCGEAGEVATFGAAPDLVGGFTSGGGFGAGPMWRVADVTAVVAGGVTTGCTVAPLHPPATTAGYYVTAGNRAY